MLDTKYFGDNLYKIKEERKQSSEKFAEVLGISPRYLNYLISGIKKPSLDTLVKISNILGVGIDFLLNNNR